MVTAPVDRFDVYLIIFDPTIGSEIKKTRPCLVISPDEMNHAIATVIAAPMTTKGRPYPTRVPCSFEAKDGLVVLDELRPVHKSRLVRRLGRLAESAQESVLDSLAEMFAPYEHPGEDRPPQQAKPSRPVHHPDGLVNVPRHVSCIRP